MFSFKIYPEYIFLFFCFFPFIGMNIGTDNQPFALMAALAVLFLKNDIRIKYKKHFSICIAIVFAAAAVSFIVNPAFDVIKRLYSYACVFVIPVAFYNCGINVRDGRSEKYMKVFMLIWFAVGCVQKFVNIRFMDILVPVMRSGGSRGVSSLANEPSFYGYMAFFFLLLSMDFKKHKNAFVFMNIMQMILLAQSAVAVIYLFIYFGLAIVSSLKNISIKNARRILFVCFAGVILLMFVYRQYASTRMGYLLRAFMNDPLQVLYTDESVNARWTAVTDSFSAFPFPGFMGGRVLMSGYGGLVYDLGVFSGILISYFWKMLEPGRGKGSKILALTITICMFSAIQLSSPMLALFMGYCVKRSES